MKRTFLNFKSKLGRWFWVIIVILLLVLWRVVATMNKTVKVSSVKVTKGDVVEAVSTSGTVKADQYSQLTFQSGGRVSWVGVKAGDKVSAGQAIAQLDPIQLNATYQQALNTYRKYQATADNVLDQVKNNSTSESFSQRDTRTTAEVNRDSAYDSMKSALDALNNATIYAPFSGIMDTVTPSSSGVNVILGSANYTILNPKTVYFDSEVEETDLPSVNVGQKVKIKLDAYPNETFDGVVQTIGAVAFTSSTGGNAYHVRISLPENIDLKFRVGMKGDSDIVFNIIPNVLKVSTSALAVEGDKNYVFVIQGGVAKKTSVAVGGASGEETEIKSGLNEGEEVVDNPPSNFKDGTRVTQ